MRYLTTILMGAALLVLAASCEKPEQDNVAVQSVTLDKPTAMLYVGETVTLTATVKPDNATAKTVTWSSSNSAVATVANGVVTAVAEGSVTITAAAGGKSAACAVTVSKKVVPVESVSLDLPSAELVEGQTITLTATVKPDNATDKTVTWSSSNEAVATVVNGVVTAVAEGNATIKAEAGGKSATCAVTVSKKAIPVESITLDKPTLSLDEGESATLTATVNPDNASDKTVTWSSSNEAVATVANGVVTAVAEGSATITAAAGGKSATCAVTVSKKAIPVESVTLDKPSLTLAEGESATLTATVKPDNATDKTVTWSSSNEAVATVANGVVTAVAEGSATITAAAGGKSATCAVTVNKSVIAVEEVTLDKPSVDLVEGETVTLTATVKPDDATDKTVIWSSSNEAVATVADGVVTAVAEGSATITAEAGGKSATCAVTVSKNTTPVESITLDKPSLELTAGQSATLIATVHPDNAADKTVTWSSSNEDVATVVNGVVTAVAEGSATITAEAGGKTATCTVTVSAAYVPISVTGVSLNKTYLNLIVGENFTLVATVMPEDAENKSVKWSSSETDIVKVSNGNVTALSLGTAVITVKTVDGGFTDTCTVNVVQEADLGGGIDDYNPIDL